MDPGWGEAAAAGGRRGVLPPQLQQYNPFAAGVLAVSKEKDVAAAMVKFMGAPENEGLVRKSGMEPPAR